MFGAVNPHALRAQGRQQTAPYGWIFRMNIVKL